MNRSSVDIKAFLSEAGRSVEKFNDFAKSRKLSGIGRAIIADHICYKCGSSESFEALRRVFESYSDYI